MRRISFILLVTLLASALAACGAGGDCGGCALRIERLLDAERPVLLRVAS